MIRSDRMALVHLIAGFTVWSIAFALLYGLQALGCAYGWPYHRAILIGAYLLMLAPLLGLALFRFKAQGEQETTLQKAAIWTNWAAFASGVLVFSPVTFASACL